MNRFSSSSERGSVMIYIMLAIGLFAALSFFVSRGGDTNVSLITGEQAKIAAQEIVDYGNTLTAAVQKLKLRGCGDTELDFANTAWQFKSGTAIHAAGHNPSAKSGCSVFSPDGGNVAATIMPASVIYDWPGASSGNPDPGSSMIITPRLPEIGNANEGELVYRLPYVTKTACMIINDLLGVENVNDEPPQVAGDPTATNAYYNGTYSSDSINDYEPINGKMQMCVRHGAGEHLYSYLAILIAR